MSRTRETANFTRLGGAGGPFLTTDNLGEHIRIIRTLLRRTGFSTEYIYSALLACVSFHPILVLQRHRAAYRSFFEKGFVS